MRGSDDGATAIAARPGSTVGADDVRARRVVTAIACAAAGIAAAFVDAHPTIHPAADVVYRIGFAVLLTLAASRARPWTWLVLAAAVLVGGRSPVAIVCGVAVVATAVGGLTGQTRTSRFRTGKSRTRELGAVAGALASVGLLHLGPLEPYGLTAVIATVGVVPVALSSLRWVDGRARRPIRWMASATVVIGALMTAGFALSAIGGAGLAQKGIDEAWAGVDAAKSGDDTGAVDHLDAATTAFGDAQGSFGAWYARPAEWLPVVGYQSRSLAAMAALGHELSMAANNTATRANYRGITMDGGQVDVDRVAALAGPLGDVRAALRTAGERADVIPHDWMAPPIEDRLDGLVRDVRGVSSEVDRAIEAVGLVPDLLGASGRRAYLVMLTTPAEARGAGGYMASWALMTADRGKLALTRAGRDVDLVPPKGAPPLAVAAPEDFLARYRDLQLDEAPGEVTSSPDFPSVAHAIASIYEQSPNGEHVDGVFSIDPYGLAALLKLTGPVRVAGITEALGADNTADMIVREQYYRSARVTLMADLTFQIFHAMLSAQGLRPLDVARDLGPMVAQRRITMYSSSAAEQQFFDELGATGRFPAVDAPPGTDLFSVVTQNSGDSRLDVYLHRDIAYEATVDPDTGDLDATATVRLTNTAPATGLPSVVARNRPDSGQPDGTNWVWFNLYSPHALVQATSGGAAIDLRAERELGFNVYGGHVAVPPGGEVVIEVHLRGQVAPGPTYRVRWYQQPTIKPDELAVRVRWRSGSSGGGANTHASDRETTISSDARTDGDTVVTRPK